MGKKSRLKWNKEKLLLAIMLSAITIAGETFLIWRLTAQHNFFVWLGIAAFATIYPMGIIGLIVTQSREEAHKEEQ